MREKSRYTLQTLILCLLVNAVLIGGLSFSAYRFFQGVDTRMSPLYSAQGVGETGAAGPHVSVLKDFFEMYRQYLIPVMIGAGMLSTLLLWLLLQIPGRRALAGKTPASVEKAKSEEVKKQTPARKKEDRASPAPAVQILSELQRQGRFIDFLQEDLDAYEDAQIGAAVRNIHEGCRQTLSEYFELKPVFEQEEEGSRVTVKPGFDARAVRLTGNVSGDPPFQGTLRHRGWRVVRAELPQRAPGEEKKPWILAPAEVEIEG